MATVTTVVYNGTSYNVTNMTLSEVQARVAALNSSVQSMQTEVENAVMLTAEIWRTTAGVFVFLMQVRFR
ncbi:unnamed protein product, partial [Closterium sp. NIES-64]